MCADCSVFLLAQWAFATREPALLGLTYPLEPRNGSPHCVLRGLPPLYCPLLFRASSRGTGCTPQDSCGALGPLVAFSFREDFPFVSWGTYEVILGSKWFTSNVSFISDCWTRWYSLKTGWFGLN